MGPGLETAIVGSSITTEQHATRAFPLYSLECVEGEFSEVRAARHQSRRIPREARSRGQGHHGGTRKVLSERGPTPCLTCLCTIK
jgi:hypothetical protein